MTWHNNLFSKELISLPVWSQLNIALILHVWPDLSQYHEGHYLFQYKYSHQQHHTGRYTLSMQRPVMGYKHIASVTCTANYHLTISVGWVAQQNHFSLWAIPDLLLHWCLYWSNNTLQGREVWPHHLRLISPRSINNTRYNTTFM